MVVVRQVSAREFSWMKCKKNNKTKQQKLEYTAVKKIMSLKWN